MFALQFNSNVNWAVVGVYRPRPFCFPAVYPAIRISFFDTPILIVGRAAVLGVGEIFLYIKIFLPNLFCQIYFNKFKKFFDLSKIWMD